MTWAVPAVCPRRTELQLTFVSLSLERREAECENECVEKLIMEECSKQILYFCIYFFPPKHVIQVSLCSFPRRYQPELVVAV